MAFGIMRPEATNARPSQTRESPIEFRITAQPLVSALEQYTLLTGIQVLYPSTLAINRRSLGVSGLYSPEEAILILLAGTQLRPRITAAAAMTLESVVENTSSDNTLHAIGNETAASDVLRLGPLVVNAVIDPPARRRHDFYAFSVRSAVRDALRRDEKLQARRYRMSLSVWLSADGQIERVAVYRSSGDAGLDEDVLVTIGKVMVRPAPPLGLPQPVHIDVLATGR